MSFKFFCTGVSLACLLLVSGNAASAQDPVLTIDVSPGPDANTVTWTFGGSTTSTGFVGFSTNGITREDEPFGMFGFGEAFTTINAGIFEEAFSANFVRPGSGAPGQLVAQSGSGLLTVNPGASEQTASIGPGYFDNGVPGLGTSGTLGFSLIGPALSYNEGDTITLAGSIVYAGASIDDFSAGGLPFEALSTRLGLEGNSLPLRLSISSVVIPEPSSACLLGLVGAGIAARRRRSRR